MQYLERTALIARPKEPFAAWVRATFPGDSAGVSVEAMRAGASVYLVAEYQDPKDPGRIVRRSCRPIFEAELSQWTEDASLWPKRRHWATFEKWFDVEVLEVVIDVDDHLEPYPADEDDEPDDHGEEP